MAYTWDSVNLGAIDPGEATRHEDGDEEQDVDLQPLKDPKSATWHQSISYKDYKKVIGGFSPVSMDDRWLLLCEEPKPSNSNRGIVHIYFSWNGEEELRGEFSLVEGAESSDSGNYAVFDKIWWEPDPEMEVSQDEARAKTRFSGALQNLLGVDLRGV